ncbi:MAG: GNAT family N-acetyltransferase [Pseudomonadota bacterium]
MAELKIDLPPSVAIARPSDWRTVAAITGEAFADDPVNRWAFGTEDAIKACFRVMTRDVYLGRGLSHLAGDEGATMWTLPGQKTGMGLLANLRFASAMMFRGDVGAIGRAFHLGSLMEKHHPKERHAYLFTIGTRRSARGKGYGKALLKPVLVACDRASLPVYLENSNPANTGFYRSFGFRSLGTFAVGDGGPLMEPMWREPLDANIAEAAA